MSSPVIAVVGLGYVGLPLSLQFARSCTTVIGIDVDPGKVEQLNNGRSYIKHVQSSDISELLRTKKFSATTDFSQIKAVEAVIICVPTPLTKNREPDISFVLETGRAIAPYLAPAMAAANSELQTPNSETLTKKLVVLESTTYPGTTDEELRAVLEENAPLAQDETAEVGGQWSVVSGLQSPKRRMRAGVDFHLAFSPEREDPANEQSKVNLIPKVVGGYTPTCLDRAMALYGKAIDTLVPVSSCRVAEATKLLENIFRSVNIALVNELKLVYSAMGIDIWEVIEAAKTKPFGFMPFYPGPGWGGHCIPIDPFYLTWKAREYGKHTRFIELAGEINTAMPAYVVHRVTDALNARSKSVNGSRVLILGLAYKPNVDDDRESPSYVLMDLLSEGGAELEYYDPYVPVIKPTREHPHWAGKKSVEWDRATIESFDLVLITTNHRCVSYQELADWAQCIVDTRNAMAGTCLGSGKVWKA
jgi:UDP-N-acetyl-D-glucosamine dehydrogenase